MKESLRDHAWLGDRLNRLWAKHFNELPRESIIVIRFGTKARQRLGSIKRRHNQTVITVTGYYRWPLVPDFVVDETIAHELVHYSHGFESPLPRLYRYPHEGNVVHRELAKRNLSLLHRDARRWLKLHWPATIQKIDRDRNFGYT